jgi:hypothetical protein
MKAPQCYVIIHCLFFFSFKLYKYDLTSFSKSWIDRDQSSWLTAKYAKLISPLKIRRVTAVDAYKTQCVLPLKAPRRISMISKVVFFERAKPSLHGAVSLRNETSTFFSLLRVHLMKCMTRVQYFIDVPQSLLRKDKCY